MALGLVLHDVYGHALALGAPPETRHCEEDGGDVARGDAEHVNRGIGWCRGGRERQEVYRRRTAPELVHSDPLGELLHLGLHSCAGRAKGKLSAPSSSDPDTRQSPWFNVPAISPSLARWIRIKGASMFLFVLQPSSAPPLNPSASGREESRGRFFPPIPGNRKNRNFNLEGRPDA